MAKLRWIPLLAVLLMACSPLAGRDDGREMRLWQLESPRVAGSELPGGEGCPTLLISSPRAAAGFATARIAYVQRPHRIDYYAFHRWVDSPARMLQPIVVRSAEASGAFRAVLSPGAPVGAPLRLTTEILYLQQLYEGEESEVQLALRVALFGPDRAIKERVLRFDEPAGRGPESGVEAANRAVARFDAALQQFLRQGALEFAPECRAAPLSP